VIRDNEEDAWLAQALQESIAIQEAQESLKNLHAAMEAPFPESLLEHDNDSNGHNTTAPPARASFHSIRPQPSPDLPPIPRPSPDLPPIPTESPAQSRPDTPRNTLEIHAPRPQEFNRRPAPAVFPKDVDDDDETDLPQYADVVSNARRPAAPVAPAPSTTPPAPIVQTHISFPSPVATPPIVLSSQGTEGLSSPAASIGGRQSQSYLGPESSGSSSVEMSPGASTSNAFLSPNSPQHPSERESPRPVTPSLTQFVEPSLLRGVCKFTMRFSRAWHA
jgi:hypothetical protein